MLQKSTLINSVFNQTLNNKFDSLAKQSVYNRLLNSSYLQYNNEQFLNTNLTYNRKHSPKDDLVTSLVKEINNLGYHIRCSVFNINQISFYANQGILSQCCDLFSTLDRNGVKYVTQLLDPNSYLFPRHQLYEALPNLKNKIGWKKYEQLQTLVNEFRSNLLKYKSFFVTAGNFRKDFTPFDVNDSTLPDQFFMVNWKGCQEIWCWTDGSQFTENNRICSGYGAFFKKGSKFNFGTSTDFIQDNSYNELRAILFALRQTPTIINNQIFNLRIFSDSQCSIDAITHFDNWKNAKTLKCKNREILRCISRIIKDRREQNSITNLCHVPSHTDDNDNVHPLPFQRRLVAESKQNRLRLLKAQFGDFYDTIIEGNRQADLLAKIGATQPFEPVSIPGYTDKFFLTDSNNKYVSGDVHKEIKDKLRTNCSEYWWKKHQLLNNSSIDMNISNFYFTEKPPCDVSSRIHRETNKNFLTKMRASALATRGEVSERGKKRKRNFRYKTPSCLFCNDLFESSDHFIQFCPHWENYRNKIITFFDNLLREYSNDKLLKCEPFFQTAVNYNTTVNLAKSLTTNQARFLQQIVNYNKKLGSRGFFPKAMRQLLELFYKENKYYNNNSPKPKPLEICKQMFDYQITTYKQMYKERNKIFQKYKKDKFLFEDQIFTDVISFSPNMGVNSNDNAHFLDVNNSVYPNPIPVGNDNSTEIVVAFNRDDDIIEETLHRRRKRKKKLC
jgi:ribonuclease HI